MGKVVVCGGVVCDSDCQEAGTGQEVYDTCWELDPATMAWGEADYSLLGPRYAHVMSLAPDFDSGSNNRVPMVSGGLVNQSDTGAAVMAEIYNPLTEEFKSYRLYSTFKSFKT